jgi:predicted XRE-type DNA-binding protein
VELIEDFDGDTYRAVYTVRFHEASDRRRSHETQSQSRTGGENIFADLGLPDAQTHFLKAQIVSEIYRLTNEWKLTQVQAGELMSISQPEVSRMFKGNFCEYSADRLMGFLTAFDRDVEIVARPRKRSGRGGRITFTPVAACAE